MGITMNSHANDYNLTVRNTSFPNTLCGVSYNYDTTTTGQIADNSLKFEGTITVDPGCYAVQKFGNAYVDGKPTTDNYYDSVEAFNKDNPVLENPTLVANAVAKVGNTFYNDLQTAVSTASTNSSITVEIVRDITLSQGITVPTGANITINGNNHTVSYPFSVNAAFGNQTKPIYSGTTLTVNELNFTATGNENTTPSGVFGILVGENTNNVSIKVNNCSFSNLYSGVYFGHFEGTNTGKLSIKNSTFTNCVNAYSIDERTAGAAVGNVTVETENNTLNDANESESWPTVEAYVTRNDVTTVASSFANAVATAQSGDVITLAKDLSSAAFSLPAGVTLDGNGYILINSNPSTGGTFITVNSGADNAAIKDITLDAGNAYHGVQFYCNDGGELNDVTINGGNGTSVIVNGATNVDIIDCVLNPAEGAYTNIEYAMGSNVTSVPSMNINNVTFDNSKSAVWADKNTTDRVENKMGGEQSNEAILAEILDNITYTSPNGGSLAIAVGFSDNSTLVGYEESTYQPPYTGKYSYEIFTKVGDNGTISVDRYATEGDNVTITVSPDEAYLLDELTVTANGKEVEVKDNGDGTYTFKMPSADAKIVVTFAEDPDWEPAPEMPFTDVNDNDWFYDVVLYAYDNGLMTGVSATEFAPNQTTTRGMIVSMLARLEGVTSAEDAGFADVAANDWYATAVNWAASVGVVNGYEDNTFRPNAPITREQMAAILYNYADYKGYDVSARADLSDYADAASISSWAEDVLAWANAEGLINGMTATTIDPQGATTRAQTAAMFERFLTAHEA